MFPYLCLLCIFYIHWHARNLFSPACRENPLGIFLPKHLQTWLKQEKSISFRGNIQIKFWLQHHISYVKIFKTRPHDYIWRILFFKYFFDKARTYGLQRTNIYLFANKILNRRTNNSTLWNITNKKIGECMCQLNNREILCMHIKKTTKMTSSICM